MSRHHAALGRAHARLRRRCLDRDDWRCTACGSPANLEMHHLRPLADGGDPLSLDNVRMLCAGCHVETHRAAGDVERDAWRRLLWEGV